jgi:hypothetical protein
MRWSERSKRFWIQGTGLMLATLLNDSKVKRRLTIEYRDVGIEAAGN